jgi:rhamnosyl/mannosyltransferase
MRILILGKHYPPYYGGIEIYTQNLAEYLAREHDVTAVVFGDERESSVIGGVRVIRSKITANLFSQPISLENIRDINPGDYDVVHFQAPNFWSAAILVAKLKSSSVPLVITHHMDVFGRRLIRRLTLFLYHALVKRADAVIVTSYKNAAVSADLPASAPLKEIPLGVDPQIFRSTVASRKRARIWRQALVGDAPLVGFIGRHARYKGLDVLVRALAKLPGVHAVIAGDGSYRATTEKLIESFGLQDRVHMVGEVDDELKRTILQAIDVFAFPSTEITEAFGISQLEAMASGAPVVAANLPTGVTDVAIDRQTALLVEPGDAESLANGLRELIENPQLGQQLAAAAENAIRTRFNHEAVFRDTAVVLAQAVARSNAAALDKGVLWPPLAMTGTSKSGSR